jgi:hypothetical protein
MSSFKKLSKADVTTVSYAANKRWSFSNSDGGGINANTNTEYVVGAFGTNESFDINGSTTINGQYRSLVYAEINHLFYQSYTSSLDTGSIMFNVNTYESASSQRPTASYFNYNTNPLLIKQFPSGSSDTIGVLSINQDIYGSKILPTSFQISQSSGIGLLRLIKDDGNGNLYEISTAQNQYVDLNWVTINYINSGSIPDPGISFIGNIFYAHGIVVLNDYKNFIIEGGEGTDATISFQNEHIIYENEVRCIVKESDYNLTYNPTLVTGNYESGSLRGFATSASFQPYATTIGLYNDDNDLLMVAKLGKPIVLSSDTDMTFIVKYDT